MDFDLETDRVCRAIEARKARTVVLQLPAGLRRRFFPLADEIRERTGAELIFAADPCYGACDPPHGAFADIEVDLFVMYGHTPLEPGEPSGPAAVVPESSEGTGLDGAGRQGEGAGNTLYIHCAVPVDTVLEEGDMDAEGLRVLYRQAFMDNILNPEHRALGLLTTAQYLHLLPVLKGVVEGAGLRVLTGMPSSRCHFPGQVLGCSFECAEAIGGEVDAFIFLGEGDFHPLGAFLATKKRVFTLNPWDGAVSQFGPEDNKFRLFMKQRLSAVGRALDAACYGIIISLKEGQRRADVATAAVGKIRAAGKGAYILALTEVTPAELDVMPVDAFVNTACPRITYDDFSRYKKPILTPFELEVVLSGVDLSGFFEEYRFDGF